MTCVSNFFLFLLFLLVVDRNCNLSDTKGQRGDVHRDTSEGVEKVSDFRSNATPSADANCRKTMRALGPVQVMSSTTCGSTSKSIPKLIHVRWNSVISKRWHLPGNLHSSLTDTAEHDTCDGAWGCHRCEKKRGWAEVMPKVTRTNVLFVHFEEEIVGFCRQLQDFMENVDGMYPSNDGEVSHLLFNIAIKRLHL